VLGVFFIVKNPGELIFEYPRANELKIRLLIFVISVVPPPVLEYVLTKELTYTVSPKVVLKS
jgi:hypothetical protein